MGDVAKLRMRFTEVDIRHRTACMGYILQGDFNLHFRDKTFSCYAFSIKIALATDVQADLPRRRTAPTLKLLLFLVPIKVANTNWLHILQKASVFYK